MATASRTQVLQNTWYHVTVSGFKAVTDKHAFKNKAIKMHSIFKTCKLLNIEQVAKRATIPQTSCPFNHTEKPTRYTF